jgi:maltooligosyltrehalose trehalohydrolase
MPVAQCPGERNWGYDGVQLYAVQHSLGGLAAMKRFVDAAHGHGLAVILDVVYNHLGPEGNYLSEFGPYFTQKYKTPWGPALNFDGRHSDEVRRFFVENALQWVRDCHVDALRLDAVHAIVDETPVPFLAELADAVKAEADRSGRRIHLIAESAANDARLVKSRDLGGLGLDGVWSDDFHHALHTLLTGEHRAYYEGFGSLDLLARAYRDGWAYSGQYSPARKRHHGSSPAGIPAERFVVCAQNHDQIGNRPLGERLVQLVGLESAKLAAATILLAPFTPLLFMGEEYGEKAPFQYFVHHGDAALVAAVRRGRREEFAEFFGESDARGHEPPDPQAEETFRRSKLDPDLARAEPHRSLLELHRELLTIRKTMQLTRESQEVVALERPAVLLVERGPHALVHHFGTDATEALVPLAAGSWERVLDTADARWAGPGSAVPRELASNGEAALRLAPRSFVLLRRRP